MFSPEIFILAELIRLNGMSRDKNLYESLKKIYSSMDRDISLSQYNKALMKLEIRGYIRVESIKRGSRMVYLVKKMNDRKELE
ncbi:MAG: hypothetical protein B6U94_03315 [Thermofilum sp. ex4484_79]|nr:MAG: hypothetical protein B6U94_03315 [Thermofilum sp. ex4484_79]